MLSNNVLKDVLSQSLNDSDKALICLAVEPVAPRKIKEITAMAFSAGWRQVKKKNLSTIFARTNVHAVRSENGWELTDKSDGKWIGYSFIPPNIIS